MQHRLPQVEQPVVVVQVGQQELQLAPGPQHHLVLQGRQGLPLRVTWNKVQVLLSVAFLIPRSTIYIMYAQLLCLSC